MIKNLSHAWGMKSYKWYDVITFKESLFMRD